MNENYSKVIVMTVGTYKIAYEYSIDVLDGLVFGKSFVTSYKDNGDSSFRAVPRNYTIEVLSREEFNRLVNPPQISD